MHKTIQSFPSSVAKLQAVIWQAQPEKSQKKSRSPSWLVRGNRFSDE